MKLYDIIQIAENDFDVYDTEYDASVTVCYDEYDGEENYDKFCKGILKKVDFTKKVACGLEADWSGLIKRNIEAFKAFTAKNWKENCQYEDDEDEFIYQWINEIHLYFAGYVDEEAYGDLIRLVEGLDKEENAE